MRGLKISGFVFIACASLFFASCESSDDSDNMGSVENVEEVKSTVSTGTWLVALYEEDEVDQTSNFAGYSFTFNSTGELSANNGETSISGAWSITSESDSSDDDNPSDDVDFNIFFSSPVKFAEISEDWEIVSFSSARIELKHVSGGDGSIDRLVFEKI